MTLRYHDLANILPLIVDDEFAQIVADMRANGYRSGEEIIILDGQILDGRNRYRAGVEAEVFPADVDWQTHALFIEWGNPKRFTPEEIARGPLDFVIAKNVRRRHLNESQRAQVADNIARLGQGEKRDDKAANLPGSLTQAEAAKALNVSERSVRDARVVRERGTPELVAAVAKGDMAVSLAAKAAKLEPQQQQKVVAEVAAGHANAVRTVLKKEARTAREQELGAKQLALPKKRYGVIYEDPEWRFEPYSRETGMDRAPENHYPTSETEVIAARPVADIAATDCVLFMWATVPMLPQALQVLAARGFAYRTHIVWIKDRVGAGRGPGFWFTGEHELLLVATRGSVPAPAAGTQWRSVLIAPVGAHSEKPEKAYELIEAYFPTLPKIELNARIRRPGWDAWGLEAPEQDPEATPASAMGASLAGEGEVSGATAGETAPVSIPEPATEAAAAADVERESHGEQSRAFHADGAEAGMKRSPSAAAPQTSDAGVTGGERPAPDHQGPAETVDLAASLPDFLRRTPARSAC